MNSKAPSPLAPDVAAAAVAEPAGTSTATPPTSSAHSPSSPPFPLLDYLDGLMEDLRAQVPLALRAWDEEAIHKSRVATRRLKAAVDLMEPVVSKRQRRPFARVLRRLRRRLGPLRDADVMLGHLREMPARQAHAADWLTAHVTGEREGLRRDSERQGPPARMLARLGAWWGVRVEIGAARDAVDNLLAESLHLQLDAFAEQADRLAAAVPRAREGEARAEPKVAPSLPPRQDPHELRISGKALRYTLEMAESAGHKLPKSVLKTFKRMQESLGGWHDFVVLADRAMEASLARTLGHYDAHLQEQVLDLTRVAVHKSAWHLDHFVKLWRERGGELADTIRARFPLTRPMAAPAEQAVRPPRTDPGPPDSSEPQDLVGDPPDAAGAA